MLVTFIVPTIWRDTLARACDSLMAQTDDDWQAYVNGDGNDDLGYANFRDAHWYEGGKLHFCWHEKVGSAGLTRNRAISAWESDMKHGYQEDSDWVAFLDDDDIVKPEYVEHLREHAEDYPWAEVIVFRMAHPQLGVLPRADGKLDLGRVGISFALRSNIAREYPFVRESLEYGNYYHEDWDLLSRLIAGGKKIFISPHTDYIVRPI